MAAARIPGRWARIPHLLRHFPSLNSTNSYVREHAASLDPAIVTVVSADHQTAGRGRLGRHWVSGGSTDVAMTFAFVIPPDALPTSYLLSPFLAVMTSRVLRKAGIDSGIKWPNDIVVGGSRKVGGILCEVETVPGDPVTYWAALGLGLNVNSTPEELGVVRPVWPLTTLKHESGKEWDVPALRQSLVDEVVSSLPAFLHTGFRPFQDEYGEMDVLKGKKIRFKDGGPGGGGAEVEHTGRVAGVGDDGRLLLHVWDPHTGKETLKGFLSGEVTGIEIIP